MLELAMVVLATLGILVILASAQARAAEQKAKREIREAEMMTASNPDWMMTLPDNAIAKYRRQGK